MIFLVLCVWIITCLSFN